MAEPIPLFPDRDPHTSQFQRELEAVVNVHMDRGHLTRAAVLGVLTSVTLDTWALFREIDDEEG